MKKKWYADGKIWGMVASGLSTILMLASPNTIAYKGGAALGIISGTVTALTSYVRDNYKQDTLKDKNLMMQKIDKVMDKMPDKLTGVKNGNSKLVKETEN